MFEVWVRFYAELNEHLPQNLRQIEFPYGVSEGTTLSVMLGLLGVPSNEIDLVLADGQSVGLSHVLKNGERVSVYPVFDSLDVTPVTKMDERPLRRMRFVLDVHLGKLAHHLRMLGFDTLYRNDYARSDLLEIAASDDRILLSKGVKLIESSDITAGYRVRSSDPREQLIEVLRRFDLWRAVHPFQRCLDCNTVLRLEEKNSLASRLPEKVRDLYHRFNLCSSCGRIYWEGTHFLRMKEFIEKVLVEGGEGYSRGS